MSTYPLASQALAFVGLLFLAAEGTVVFAIIYWAVRLAIRHELGSARELR